MKISTLSETDNHTFCLLYEKWITLLFLTLHILNAGEYPITQTDSIFDYTFTLTYGIKEAPRLSLK